MPLSQSEREMLVARVQQKLTTRDVSHTTVERIVDEVASHLDLPDEIAPSAHALVAFSAASTPDLASRVHRQLSQAAVIPNETGVATVGRHTVVTMRLPAVAVSRAESAASALGIRFAIVSRDTAGLPA